MIKCDETLIRFARRVPSLVEPHDREPRVGGAGAPGVLGRPAHGSTGKLGGPGRFVRQAGLLGPVLTRGFRSRVRA
jgi:hypothetical protein